MPICISLFISGIHLHGPVVDTWGQRLILLITDIFSLQLPRTLTLLPICPSQHYDALLATLTSVIGITLAACLHAITGSPALLRGIACPRPWAVNPNCNPRTEIFNARFVAT